MAGHPAICGTLAQRTGDNVPDAGEQVDHESQRGERFTQTHQQYVDIQLLLPLTEVLE